MNKDVIINIAKDFTRTPGARYRKDGKYSGQEFYEELLKKKYKEAIDNKTKLLIYMDGTHGYASSFLNESFSLLSNDFKENGRFVPDKVWNNLIIKSDEVPEYKDYVQEAIYDERK